MKMKYDLYLIQTALGTAGTVTGLCALLAPVSTFRQIIKSQSADRHSPWPYVCTLFSCASWAFYGLPAVANSTSVMVINAAGSVIQATYCLIFFVYTSDAALKHRLGLSLGALAVGLSAFIFFTLTAIPQPSRGPLVGLLGDLASVLSTAAPLAAVRTMVKTQNVQFFPIALCAMNLANTGIWSLFGISTLDVYVTLPNLAGVMLSATQVFLYFFYRKNNPQKIDPKNAPEVDAAPFLKSGNYFTASPRSHKSDRFLPAMTFSQEPEEQEFEEHWEDEEKGTQSMLEMNRPVIGKKFEDVSSPDTMSHSAVAFFRQLSNRIGRDYFKGANPGPEVDEGNYFVSTVGRLENESGWRTVLR